MRVTLSVLVVAFASLAVGAVAVGASGSPAGAATSYVPLGKPARLLDTRPGQKTVDGESAAVGLRRAGSVYRLQVTGRANIGADATAVVINATVTEPKEAGFATVYPCGGADAERVEPELSGR